MRYSRGFNPRPRLSLPLPRTVAVASDDDLVCLWVNRDPSGPQVTDYESRIKDRLSGQLPKDCELISVEAAEASVSYQPDSATYIFSVPPEYIDEKLMAVIERLLTSESLNLQRRVDAKNLKFKNVDVRPFLKSIKTGDKAIIVECKISSAGTVRVDEILKLLELDTEMLTAPIRRTSVKWQVN
jgi:radical SAM-linked protein